MKGWIGVDFDRTLSVYRTSEGRLYFGPPVPAMLERVKEWVALGHDVRIFTARIAVNSNLLRNQIIQGLHNWTETYVGKALPVTNVKDQDMWVIFDDRALQVERNTGIILSTGDWHEQFGL